MAERESFSDWLNTNLPRIVAALKRDRAFIIICTVVLGLFGFVAVNKFVSSVSTAHLVVAPMPA